MLHAALLPVQLPTFTAALAGPATVRLARAAASEKNSTAFEVERSLDGRTFARIGTAAAASAATSCRMCDCPPAPRYATNACGR